MKKSGSLSGRFFSLCFWRLSISVKQCLERSVHHQLGLLVFLCCKCENLSIKFLDKIVCVTADEE